MSAKYPTEKFAIIVPDLSEISSVLQDGLENHFQQVRVSVVPCPDLRSAPYNMAAAGISGAEKAVEVGSVGYLLPTPKLDKFYNHKDIAEIIGMSSNVFLLGK